MPGARAVLVDAGPLVAIFDRDDAYHGLCVDELRAIARPLVSVWPVIAEAMYLLSFSRQVQDDLWEFIQRGGVDLAELGTADVPRLRELMRKYGDRPMDLADAALVRIAERDGLSRVFTLDHTDFTVYRLPRGKSFTLIPGRLT